MYTFVVVLACVLTFLAITAGLSLAFWDQEPEDEPVRVEHHPIVMIPSRRPYDWKMIEEASTKRIPYEPCPYGCGGRVVMNGCPIHGVGTVTWQRMMGSGDAG